MKTKMNLNLLAVLAASLTALASCSKSDPTPVKPDPDPNPGNNETDKSLQDPFFDKVAYKGAFGTTDWTAGWVNYEPNKTVYPAATEELSGDISVNRTLDASKTYLLKGFVYIKDGATLTIPAGTIIRGDKLSKASLVVTRGGKINAEGTATKPIVFTSNEPVDARRPGDWGGIIILGKAPNNIPGGEGLIEGGLTKPYGNHGGNDAEDNSGVLKYVRVEYPGIAYSTDNEINGVTFGSVGSKTTIDYVQVAYSGDDSFEWFGGTVNAKHLVSTANIDDIFDFDNGYVGKLQYLVGIRDPKLADQAGQSNGIESDNSEKVFDSSPRTKPVISNMTLIGPGNDNPDTKHEYANLWRRGSKMVLANSIFINMRYGIDIRDKETGDALRDKSSLIKNNIYQSFTADKTIVADGKPDPSFENADLLKAYLTENNNKFLDEAAAKNLLVGPYSLTAPNFLLKSGSEAATGASF